MRRQKMRNKARDNRVFARTAKHVRKKNLIVNNMRGGIRL